MCQTKVKRYLLVFLSITASLSILLLTGCSGTKTSAEEKEEENYIPVEVSPVTLGEINLTTSVSGSVEAAFQVAVMARSAGEIKTVHISSGQQVKKGDILLTLESPEVSLQARQAREGLDSLKEMRDELEEWLEELEEIMEEDDNSDGDFNWPWSSNAQDEDSDEGSDSLPDSQEDESQPESEEENLDQEEENNNEDWDRILKLLQGQMDPTSNLRQQIRTLEAQIKQGENSLEIVEMAAANLIIKAPASGTVTQLNAVKGNMATPGNPLMIISNTEEFQIEARVLENLIFNLNPGDEVLIELPTLNREYSGILTEVARAPLLGTKFYQVKSSFNPTGQIVPGMFARLSFTTESVSNTLVIPRRALLEKEGREVVYVAVGDRAEEREVVVGLVDKEIVEIKKGLREGESLVLRGHHYLKDGSLLKVIEGGVK